MAQDKEKKEKYKNELLQVIKTNKIAFFDHSFAFTTFSRRTAYDYGLHELHDIKDQIDDNRVKAKNYLLNKWIGSDNPTLQLAAFRLLSVSEEHKLLNQTYTDHTTNGKEINIPIIEWVKNYDKDQ